MKTVHEPVLLKEVIELLQPRANDNFIDGTLGGGGHARALLQKTGSDGLLLGLDADPGALERALDKLQEFGDRVVVVHSSYTEIKQVVYDQKFQPIRGIILDLGLSTDQLKVSGRGFSFQMDEPLDMRFDTLNNDLTAATIVNEWSETELLRVLREYGEEPFARRIVKGILERRLIKPIETTHELVEIIKQVVPQTNKKRKHPATRTFQALRIAVNHELENVKKGLEESLAVLEKGSRLAVITFHSLEDRIVKHYFQTESKGCQCPPQIPVCRCNHEASIKLITKKAVMPSAAEVEQNPASRSAKLRVVEKK